MSDSTGALHGAIDLSGLVNQPAAAAEAAGAASRFSFTADTRSIAEFIDLSSRVPVLVLLMATWSEQARDLGALLDRLVAEKRGALVLVRVDAEANPQLTQAFGATGIPTLAAVIAGRPLPLFQGVYPEEQIVQVLDQLLQVAAQQGVAGTLDAGETPAEPTPEPLPPLHQEAYDAIERGDLQAAVDAYRKAIAQNPGDGLAKAGLAQVSLLQRVARADADAVRTAAADDPSSVDAALAVADVDVSGGHVDDAFDRLLALFPALDAAQKNAVRERLVEFFEVVGPEDPRVVAARRRLTNLLY
ncbi:tetratricopeptide repeat protein [Gryllotalpicola sp.]|uniref:tetratricopeptide repeat protein n=1 Tax=Gryllotalpicola sp. TaxID=1932787 RepID=UPI002629CDD4|nr:tetratricopeptide repeat protein [Gryllotalpicola sp.]